MTLPKETNRFKAFAFAAWSKGEDGEDVARELAEALVAIVIEGNGVNCNVVDEFKRLISA